LLTAFFSENLILSPQVLEHQLLLPIDPASQDQETERPGEECEAIEAPDTELQKLCSIPDRRCEVNRGRLAVTSRLKCSILLWMAFGGFSWPDALRRRFRGLPGFNTLHFYVEMFGGTGIPLGIV